MTSRYAIRYTYPQTAPNAKPDSQYVVGFFREPGDPPVENMHVSRQVHLSIDPQRHPQAAIRAALIAERVGGTVETVRV